MFFDHLPAGGFVCGHRGARSIAPENTLLAMTKAKECGADCWETDVRLSRDGEPVIHHDPTLTRTTDIADHPEFKDRAPWPIDLFSTAELRSLDAGSWFADADPFGTIASGEVSPQELAEMHGQKIPLLQEVLNSCRKHQFPVNIEIKDLGTAAGDVHVVDKIINLLKQTKTTDLVLLSSFRYEYLYRARHLDQAVALAMLAEDRHPAGLIKTLSALSPAAYHPDAALCDSDLIRELQEADIRINPWTVNDIEQAQAMLQAGMGVITDRPQRLTGTARQNQPPSAKE